jgi:hypothetical protein
MTEIRTVEVESPSIRAETRLVIKLAFHIGYCAALVIFGRAHATAEEPTRPGVRKFQDLSGPDQRVFRALQEGLVEAERERSRGGSWPDVPALAAQGIPPFAPDPIDKAGYAWRLVASGTLVNYVGSPSADSSRPSFLAIVTEPEPGSPPDPQTTPDEFHHKLANGTMIHVSMWMGPGLGDRDRPVATVSADGGWAEVIVGSATSQEK